MLIGHPDGSLFAFAGLWESWKDIKSCTIITTAANDFMLPVHDRMPVILSPDDYDQWLTADGAEAEELLLPNSEGLTMKAVSKVVNNARNDVPECVEPVAPSGLF
jgi:putative SOS response-associated peptidase YedK